MTREILITDLTKTELKFFLNLSELEDAQPQPAVGTKAKLRERLFQRIGSERIRPLDVNYTSAETFAATGLSDAAVEALRAHRPFYHTGNFDALPQLTTADRRILDRLFETPALSYVPPGLDVSVALEPKLDAPPIAVTASTEEEAESDGGIGADLNYRIISAVEVEAAEDSAPIGAARVLPAFATAEGGIRYLDPYFVAVQARTSVDDTALTALLSQAGCIVYRVFPTPGLFFAKLISKRHGIGALNRAIAVLNGSELVSIAEPAWVGFDEIESDPNHGHETEDTSIVSPLGSTGTPWNMDLIDAHLLSGVTTGTSDVTLACVDTGVEHEHPAISDAIKPQAPGERRDFTRLDDAHPEDDAGHGTAVAGILVGDGSSGVTGLAPGCELLPIKVPLSGRLSSYALRREALLSLAERAEAGERIVANISWRTTGNVALIQSAIEELTHVGAIVVCSAGNGHTYPGQPHFPSDYPVTISVAAVTAARVRAGYSYFGDEVDIAAPGGDDERGVVCAALGGSAAERFGTSFAAPHVSATLGLIWSRLPQLSALEVRRLVEDNARPTGDDGLGAGVLDLGRLATALAAERPIDPGTVPPGPAPSDYHATGGPFPMAGNDLAEWSADCAVKSITRRIFAVREHFERWDEIRDVLGMTDDDLACLKQVVNARGGRR